MHYATLFFTFAAIAAGVCGKKAKPRVVVVGAGFAGLGAATTLESKGFSVTVLEARNRVGGRSFTDQTTFSKPTDMGAMWIHGIKNNPVYELAQKYSIKTTPTDYLNVEYHKNDGTLVPADEVDPVFKELSKKMNKVRNKAEHDISLGATMDQAMQELGYDQATQDLMKFKICDDVELDVAASIKNLSGWNWDADDNLLGGDVIISDDRGYAGIVDPLGATLKDLRLNHVVKNITYGSGKGEHVEVFTNNGTIEAEYVIVAASLGTLKRNLFTFAPALPSALQTAIKRLGCDVSDKVVMEFPVGSAASWGGPKLEAFYHIGDEPDHHGEFVENWNINHYSGRDMLMSFSVGQRDWALIECDPTTPGINPDVCATNTDAIVQERALAAIRTIHPAVPDPIKTHVHRWGDDPYASCTWSSWFVNSSPKDTKQFLAGVPSHNVIFAGEHATRSHPGTTHGAWNTGLSAAKAVEHASDAAKLYGENAGANRKTPEQVMEEIADMREKMQTPRPEDVLEVPYLHSPKKHWCRLQRQLEKQGAGTQV